MKNTTITDLYLIVKKDDIEDTFPNMEIAVRIFLSVMFTN